MHWPSMLPRSLPWYRAKLPSLTTRIGKAIRLRRRALGLSQQELAERCDLSTTYIARLELAKRPENPSLNILEALARGLACDVEDLVARRPSRKLLQSSDTDKQEKLLAESASQIRTEHLALLIELAMALRELANKKTERDDE